MKNSAGMIFKSGHRYPLAVLQMAYIINAGFVESSECTVVLIRETSGKTIQTYYSVLYST